VPIGIQNSNTPQRPRATPHRRTGVGPILCAFAKGGISAIGPLHNLSDNGARVWLRKTTKLTVLIFFALTIFSLQALSANDLPLPASATADKVLVLKAERNPNAEDIARARKLGVPAGGDLFLHGLPNDFDGPPDQQGDWTEGCIAVTNAEIDEIWRAIPDGTPIQIKP
jgi:L,D-transpeptidase catalytic domain